MRAAVPIGVFAISPVLASVTIEGRPVRCDHRSTEVGATESTSCGAGGRPVRVARDVVLGLAGYYDPDTTAEVAPHCRLLQAPHARRPDIGHPCARLGECSVCVAATTCDSGCGTGAKIRI